MKKKILLYDTTLRDGGQAEGVAFSLPDKLRIADRLDRVGIHYIEGGWPGSNPKDMAFFREIKKYPLRQARVVAFGSTRRAGVSVKKDPNVISLLEAGTPAIAVFGKSWILHVTDVLRAAPDTNLEMIRDTVSYLKSKGKELIYDAEHFFDGYKDDPEYALATLKAAADGGAEFLVLCDTNGGCLPEEISGITNAVRESFTLPLGIHTHDDGGLATANTLAAVRAGAVMVQGTINGYGERTGNANLCSIIPNLVLKMGLPALTRPRLRKLGDLSRFVDEMANITPNPRAPFVGESAFAHKGGMHVDAVRKNPRTFEHIQPEEVGNRRRVLVSELSGKSNVILKAVEFGVDLDKETPETARVLEELKRLGEEGYDFEGADASFRILLQKAMGKHKDFFKLEGFRVIVEKRQNQPTLSEATVKIRVGEKSELSAGEGDGPVNALDNALRKVLLRFYPEIREVHLADFKVRDLDASAGTAAKVRVLIQSRDRKDIWGTVGVSQNIIEAAYQALVDSVDYKLLKQRKKKPGGGKR